MTAIADAYLAHHFAFRPVDASFMGLAGHDDRLPDVSAGAADAERRGLAALRATIDAVPEVDEVGARLDRRLAHAQIAMTGAALEHLPRFANPAWYSGEAAFAIIGLLLPSGRATPIEAVHARLSALPDFLADAAARLSGIAAGQAQTARARREAAAMATFLTDDIRAHPDWHDEWDVPAARAAKAFETFSAAIATLPDRPVACGSAYLELLMRDVHGLDFGPDEALRRADRQFAAYGEELAELARQVDPSHTADQIIAGLSDLTVTDPAAVIDRYRALDGAARAGAGSLVSTADDYALEYRWMAACFAKVAQALYFLPYRSPAAGAAGSGSVYWVGPPPPAPATDYLRANCEANVKIIHAVHHGSVGHHTQNARARTAASRLARVAGTDCALGLAFLSSGTMVEGWACYVQDMMGEAPDFYTPAERVYLKQMEMRNVASIFVDIRLATGEWSPAQAATFYREEGGFAPARVDNEVTRNAMLPGTRLMYAIGVDAIRDLRRRWNGNTRSFHDTLIGYGHVPVAWAGEEMARAGLLT